MLVNKIKRIQINSEEVEDFIEALGSEYPVWPLPNVESSTQEEFWGWRRSYSFNAEAWLDSQVIEIDGKTQYGNIIVYWLNLSYFIDGGFAVVIANDRSVHYFKWGKCEHKFIESSIRNCHHLYTCQKCKKSFDVHSD